MKFNEYLKKNQLRQSDFAAIVGVSQARISRAVSGIQPARGRVARKWAEATNWQVTPHDFCPEDFPNPTDALPPEIQNTVFSEGKLNDENQTRAHP